MSLLAMRDVFADLDGKCVLDRVTLGIRPGELVGLLGPNGAGKTSLMRAALGLRPARGAISLGEAQLTTLSPADRALRAAYVPQDRSIAWPITVEALVRLGRYPHRTPEATDTCAVDTALERMELQHFRHRPATRLSGGEAARALIARALAQQAPLLLADEPLAGLDPAHAIGLLETLRTLARDGQGILVSLHDLGAAVRWCDRVILLDRGRVVADDNPGEVLSPGRLRDVFGITALRAWHENGPVLAPTGLSKA